MGDVVVFKNLYHFRHIKSRASCIIHLNKHKQKEKK